MPSEFRESLSPEELELYDAAIQRASASVAPFAIAATKNTSSIPSWLDPSTQITEPEATRFTPGEFATQTVNTILELDPTITAQGAFEIAAHFGGETGYGHSFRAYNLGGVLITRPYAAAYRNRTGRSAPWWRAPGHPANGDGEWLYLRAYPNLRAFVAEWLAKYLPRPGAVSEASRYARTGKLFWAHDPGWFRAMLEAGYRGQTTEEHKDRSVAVHRQITERLKVLYAQGVLRMRETGRWTQANADQMRLWQRAHGIPASGVVDPETIAAMSGGALKSASVGATLFLLSASVVIGAAVSKAVREQRANNLRR